MSMVLRRERYAESSMNAGRCVRSSGTMLTNSVTNSDDTRADVADLAKRLRNVSHRVGLDQADLARVLEMNPRTIARWLGRESQPRPQARERLLELIAVLEQLSGVLKPDAAHDWLFTPNPVLDHHKPVELLRAGDCRRVLGVIDGLAEGVFA